MDLTQTEISFIADCIFKKLKDDNFLINTRCRWLTLKEAMEYAKVKSSNTILKWIDEGYIYGHKRSGHWIIDRQSIDDWFLSEKI